MKQKLLHLFEKNPDMKTPRARKRRSFLFRFLLSFCIVLMGVGVGSTLKRVWDDYHKTGTADVKDNSAEIEQQVLTGIRTKKLHDLSPEKPKEIVYKTIKKGAVPSDTIHQPTETNIQFTDMGYISEKPSLKKLLTSGQKAGSTFYVIVKITATGESKVTYDRSYPMLYLGTQDKVGHSSKQYPDGKILYQGYTIQGNPFISNQPSYAYAGKTLKKGATVTVTYTFDLSEHKADKHTKQLQVFVLNKDYSSTLTHQFDIKE